MFSQVKDRLNKLGHLQPLNIFLRQEIDRMQRVVTAVRNTLNDLKLAIDGTIIMSEILRDALDSMYDARTPATWKRVSMCSCYLASLLLSPVIGMVLTDSASVCLSVRQSVSPVVIYHQKQTCNHAVFTTR